jgi:5-hydroxyisourate hydrolase
MSLSTHVLDASSGRPAVGVRVELRAVDGLKLLATASTDSDGRISAFDAVGPLDPGKYQLVFDTGAYFAGNGVATFYPEVCVTFQVTAADSHVHVPLLLSPFAYSTYRGS